MTDFDTPEPISVALSLVMGDTRIIASERTTTVVTVSPSDGSSQLDVRAADQTRVQFAPGRLHVKAPRQLRHYSPFGTGGSVDISIELPSGSRVQGATAMGDLRGEGRLGQCNFKTSTGHVWLEQTGPLYLSTATGDITVDRVDGPAEVNGCGVVRIGEIGGAAVIKNANGDTWVGEVTGDLRCNAVNGEVVVDRAHADVAAKTANGDIRIGETVRGSVDVATGCGNLEVGIREGTAALLDLASHFGIVHNALQPTEGPGTAQETVELRARTSYGDIVIRRS